MKYLLVLTVGLFLVACDNASYTHSPLCESQQSDTEVIITCGTDITTIPIPQDGSDGQDGVDGDDGQDGNDGEDALQSGLICNVHDLSSWSGITDITDEFINNPPVGEFIMDDVSVGNTQAINGFPGMPASIQSQVGTDGYALDCYGYLATPTSGDYDFDLLSDDGVFMAVDGQTVISDPSLHAPSTDSNSARLLKGMNRINIMYYQGPHSQIALRLKWSGPNHASQVIPSAYYFH